MTKSNSFNKREIEKKKQSKRLEKQLKKENKKNSGGSGSFEDMIAYVDENGVITSTPPDPTKKKEVVDIEDIEISTPKKTEADEPTELQGRVEYFDYSKGYGFIKDLNRIDKYFFHKSNVTEEISENDIVTFELERGQRGMNAVNIRLVKVV